MSDATTVFLWLLAGGALGCVYFPILWWTVRRLAREPGKVAWLVLGLVLRLALALAALLLAVRFGGWPGLLAALVGFIAVRTLVVRRIREAADAPERAP